MARLFSVFVRSPEVRARMRRISVLLLTVGALIGWWMVVDEGPSRARVIGASATSVAALLQVFFPGRRRLV
ncbi:MAG: hypothetical protein JXB46_07770, partial [Candidatus Eisenbacteria bacterium]|nr:hypothetical protein [Candidatus Eisenbacteria bacterium]